MEKFGGVQDIVGLPRQPSPLHTTVWTSMMRYGWVMHQADCLCNRSSSTCVRTGFWGTFCPEWAGCLQVDTARTIEAISRQDT
eukprot:6199115-Amphidinium_carterae.1